MVVVVAIYTNVVRDARLSDYIRCYQTACTAKPLCEKKLFTVQSNLQIVHQVRRIRDNTISQFLHITPMQSPTQYLFVVSRTPNGMAEPSALSINSK